MSIKRDMIAIEGACVLIIVSTPRDEKEREKSMDSCFRRNDGLGSYIYVNST